jgi:hypothetical protein
MNEIGAIMLSGGGRHYFALMRNAADPHGIYMDGRAFMDERCEVKDNVGASGLSDHRTGQRDLRVRDRIGIQRMIRGAHDAAVTGSCDAWTQLRLLAARLQGELRDVEAALTVDHVDNTIVVAYRGVVVLYWRVANGELACFPTGWRLRSYTAPHALRAHEITTRLLFEFVRGSVHAPAGK